jgi:hypothetical protein
MTRCEKILLLNFVFVQLFSLITYCQDYKQEIIRINKAYENINGVIIDAKLLLFNSFTATESIENQVLNIHRKGGNYVYKMGASEIIRNENYFLLIDNNNQVIILDSASKQKDEPQYFILSRLDSTLKQYKNVQLSFLNTSTNRLIFFPGTESVDRFEVFYNKNTYLIEKIIFFIHVNNESGQSVSNARVEIIYTRLNTNTNFSKNEFSVSRIVKLKGNNAVLMPAYAGYKLYNNLIAD